ncbi:phage major capsid protein [Globicatella sanguinis]
MNLKTTAELKTEFKNMLNDDNATQDQIFNAMEKYFNAVSDEKAEQVRAEYEVLKNVTDQNALAARGIRALTSKELAFYNEVQKTGQLPNGDLLPETIIESVFDNIQKDRPLLRMVKFVPGTGRQKVITSKRFGKAVWGPLHRDLEGQLDATFDATETDLKSLTAYFLISNDTLDLGPAWIDRYIRLCLQEAVAEAWEEAIVTGDGSLGPIGLLKDVNGAVVSGKYPDLKSAGTLTFAHKTIVKEMTDLLASLSEYEVTFKDPAGDEKKEKRYRVVDGKVNLIINPADYYKIVAPTTTQNANGTYVTNLPFISTDKLVQSEFVPAGKVIVALDGGYEAQTAFNNRIYTYKETFAMKRATLMAIDVFGDGRPAADSKVLVFDFKPASVTDGTNV